MKGLTICVSVLLSIGCASQSGLICYVRHAISEQANTIDLAPDATVCDLAQSIIDLGALSGLALPFVTADELTMNFGDIEMQSMNELLSDLGVGQQALITYQAKKYQIEGSVMTVNREMLNLGHQSYTASNFLVETVMHYSASVGQTGVFAQIIRESREQLEAPPSAPLSFRFVCNVTSEKMMQERRLILVTASAQRSCYRSIGPGLDTRLVKSAMFESFDGTHQNVMQHPFNIFGDGSGYYVGGYHLNIDIEMPEGLTLLIFETATSMT